MRAALRINAYGDVVISYDTADGRVTRTFTCPIGGGYVREVLGPRHHPYAHEKLASEGPHLICVARFSLINVIRRQYRAMRRADPV